MSLKADLVEAVQRGYVIVDAASHDSYDQTRLHVENRTNESILLDFSRTGFVPTEGDAQRVGLSHPVGFGPGTYELEFEPGLTADVVFASRCLDRTRPAPPEGMTYRLIPMLLPTFIVDALRIGLTQVALWELITQHGGSWGEDPRPLPVFDHRALEGDWRGDSSGGESILRIHWNEGGHRYEGTFIHCAPELEYVGFRAPHFAYLAWPTENPTVVNEQCLWLWGANGVIQSEDWRDRVMDLSTWPSYNEAIFYDGQREYRLR